MGWNEPGGSDPWGGRGGGDQRPPDLDEALRKLQQRMGGIFGGGRGGATAGGGGRGGLGLLLVVALAVWGFSGIYIVDPAERGVVLQFGKYSESTEPGPHWHIPFPVERVEKVNVDRVQSIEVGFKPTGGGRGEASVLAESLMLTQDENIVDVRLAVQYRIKDARDYLFQVRDPESTLRQAAESAVREVVGKSKMDFVITEGRTEIAARTKELIQEILDRYQSGLVVTTVNLADAQAPDEVQDAFADAIKAREDEVRFKNEAEAYSNEIIPKARGAAARQIEEASAYKESVIAKAEGEASRFNNLYAEYAKAPEVTRERLYIETVESVLGSTSKVMVDVKGDNLLYLPLDKSTPQADAEAAARAAAAAAASARVASPAQEQDRGTIRRLRDNLRQREVR